MNEIIQPSKIDLGYSDEKVLFLICDCSLDKKYSFYSLTKEEAKQFIGRLRTIEGLSWSQFGALPREKGITTEKSGTESFGMIDEQNTSPEKITEQYYFHFRVGGDKFRVFGYQKKRYFCITHIDPQGKIHHT
jgi:hypothetical protein